MIVVDIDGTIADNRHRQHLLKPVLDLDACRQIKCPYLQPDLLEPFCLKQASCDKKHITQDQWDNFLNPELILQDGIIPYSQEVLATAVMYHDIVFLTGRNEKVRQATTIWLKDVFGVKMTISLHMRTTTDHDQDYKRGVLSSIKLAHDMGSSLYAIDDDLTVADAYKEQGFKFFHAPGCWENMYSVMGIFS